MIETNGRTSDNVQDKNIIRNNLLTKKITYSLEIKSEIFTIYLIVQ